MNKVPKSKSKNVKPRQSKTNLKKTIRIKRTQRITEYIADTKHHFLDHDKEDENYGDTHTQKELGSIRLWYTNPCGLGISHNSTKSHGSFQFIKSKSKADLIGLVETNVNWNKLSNANSLYSRVKSTWREFRTVTSHNITEKMGRCQRGGTCMFSISQISHRVEATGKDKRGLGRWTWMEFQGRGNHRTRIITAYRPGLKPHESKLTTVYDQHMRYIRKKSLNTDPRKLFDTDIKKEIQTLLGLNIKVILMIDVNENVIHGEFTKMMMNLTMENAFTKYLCSELPPTHHRGSVPISAIYVTPDVTIRGAGILSKGIGIQGDHRNMFLDVSETSLLGSPMYKVEPPKIKLLKLNDPRIYKKFITKVKNHYIATGLNKKLQDLTDAIEEGTLTPLQIQMEQEKIDDQMGRGISKGLKKCRKIYAGEIPFSSAFLELLKIKRLWLLVLKKKLGQKISNKTIRRLSKSAGVHNPMGLPIQVIKSYLKEAEIHYKSFIPHAPTERQRFYEELAAANAIEGTATKASMLKRIMNTEAAKENGKKMSQFFPKRSISKRVDRVTFTHEGVNQEATEPEDIVHQIQKETQTKYTSSHDTPLMETSIHNRMGNFADTEWAIGIQSGTIPYPSTFTPWIERIMRKLRMNNDIPTQHKSLTKDEIKSAWKSIKEKKASSWSGRYNAVYKAFCYDPYLLTQLTMSMNLPFLSGIAYSRWYKFLDIMSFKKETSIHVSTLRTIIISEADWNTAGKIFITRRMMKSAEKSNLLPNEHLGGRKNKKSTDGGLTKRLILDNARLLQKPMAIVSTDAANCYDRMIHKIIAMAARKWGVPDNAIKSLLSPLQKAQHFTRTAFGDSFTSFTGTNLQGAGQGNTGAAPFWTMVSTHMIQIMKEMKYQATFLAPITKKKIMLSLIAFVDDTELFLTKSNDNLKELVDKANSAINTWRELLNVTGGAMRPSKCAWTLMRFDSKKNRAQYEIVIPNEEGIPTPIQSYKEKEPRTYLGISQRTDGSEKDQIEEMYKSIEKWNTQMSSSKLYPSQNLRATLTKISRSILYPLPALSLTETQCIKISNKLYSACLPKCGVSSKFPIQYRYLPHQYQGLGLPDVYFEQESAKLKELVFKSYTDGVCWQQMELGLEIAQSIIGVKDIIFNANFIKYGHLLPQTWIKSVWKFIFEQKLNIRGWKTTIPPSRDHDPTIMEVFIQKGVGKTSLQVLNKCRRYLEAVNLSDICTGDGLSISTLSIQGSKRHQHINTYSSTQMQKPSVRDLYMWKQYIRTCFCIGSNSNKLMKPLGKWKESTFSKFTWYYKKSEDMLMKRLSQSTFRLYKRDLSRRTSTRSNKIWYKVYKVDAYDLKNDDDIWAATVQENGHERALVDGTYPFEKANQLPLPVDLLQQLKLDDTPEWVYKHIPNKYLQIPIAKITSIMNNSLRIASDGSFKTKEMGAATIIETYNRHQRIILPTPVPRNSTTHLKADSYRAEATGITAALHLIRAMERLSNTSTKLELACDNDRVLEVVQTFTYINPNMKHHDVIRSMIEIRDSLKSDIKYLKVQAHRSERVAYDELTRMEQINTECDLLAKIARQELPTISGKDNVFQSEGLSIWDASNEKLTCNLHESIFKHYFSRKAQTTMMQKFGWDVHQYEAIDWQANHKANSLMSQSTKQWISKFVTKFLPIGRNMLRRQHWREDYCPRCRVCVETHDHLLTCTHHQCQHTFRVSLEKIDLWLQAQLTPTKLIFDILHVITEWKMGIETCLSSVQTYPVRNQIRLGVRHFIEGRILQDFATYMEDHYRSINSKKTGSKWAATFLQKMWTVLHRPQWENRNSFVHKINEEAIKTRERENLQNELTTLYLSNLPENLLTTDQHLYSKTLSELLQQPNAHIMAWVEEMRVALSSRDRQFLPTQQRAAAFMHAWMRGQQMAKNQNRKQKRKRRVNPRPRRQISAVSGHRWRKRPDTHPRSNPKRRKLG